MEKGEVSYGLIVDYFGPEVLDEDGNIDRKKLGLIVYQDKDKLLKLNSFSHPYVMGEVENIIELKREENYKYVCVETALPREAGLTNICDKIWFIYTPDDVRIKRLKLSRNYPNEKTKDIMSKQLSNEEYKKYSTNVIINEGTKENIMKQIDKIIGK